ncbi:retrovirus-related Pol polyprotein from transposon 297 [Trichonephila clavipes]|nr:retrovirus-related Pol polyprotein from transposon 297 [Trichonephila clavipes]
MLRDGTICPINSPYASPVVLTRKNNDLPPDSPEAYRFAIDYRKLNAITKYPRYPLPVIDDLLTNIPHTNVMSTLDLRSGYFQLAISPKDIEKQRLSLAMALLHSYACLLVFLERRLISKGLSI